MSESGSRSLAELVRRGDLKSLEDALAAGIDVEQEDEKGWNALMWACRTSNAEAVRLLLTHGANIHARLPHGAEPLDIAASWHGAGAPDVVRQLLDAGAEVNHRDVDGFTALAAILNDLWQAKPQEAAVCDRVIDLLLERGADPKICNRLGEGPIDKARRNKHTDVLRRLLKAPGVASHSAGSRAQPKKAPLVAEKSGWWSRILGVVGGRGSRRLRDATYDQLVAQLRDLSGQLDSWKDEQGEDELGRLRAQAQELGKELHVRGGKEMMLRAHRDAGGTRSIEVSWDGIGPWRG